MYFKFLVVCLYVFFFLVIRRPPESTQSRSSAASDVYKRQEELYKKLMSDVMSGGFDQTANYVPGQYNSTTANPVSYTHLRAHETPEHLVCRLLLEKKKIITRTNC